MTKFVGGALGILICCGVIIAILGTAEAFRSSSVVKTKHTYTVESFDPDMTIRIQCSGDCDIAAMIAEAREAVGK